MALQYLVDAFASAAGCIPTDAGVYNAMRVALFAQAFLQQTDPTLIGRDAVGGAKAIAQNNDGGIGGANDGRCSQQCDQK